MFALVPQPIFSQGNVVANCLQGPFTVVTVFSENDSGACRPSQTGIHLSLWF